MAHALPPPPGHRRRQLLTVLAGVIAVVVIAGIVVWVTRSGHSRQTSATPPGGTSAGTSTPPSTTPSATTTAPATTSPATTTPATTAPATTPPAKTTPTTAKPTPAPTAVPLIVANNTGIAGLADAASARFASKGWTVSALTNYDGGILSTCAYFDPANPAAQAASLVLQKQFPSIQRVLPRFDGLPSGPIVVVLTDSID